ncbi:MAG: hypothetical protein KTR14_05015 [Vampirovibrio sp.]|nr:hypothetical protein [Vampirovibrio sp.]
MQIGSKQSNALFNKSKAALDRSGIGKTQKKKAVDKVGGAATPIGELARFSNPFGIGSTSDNEKGSKGFPEFKTLTELKSRGYKRKPNPDGRVHFMGEYAAWKDSVAAKRHNLDHLMSINQRTGERSENLDVLTATLLGHENKELEFLLMRYDDPSLTKYPGQTDEAAVRRSIARLADEGDLGFDMVLKTMLKGELPDQDMIDAANHKYA